VSVYPDDAVEYNPETDIPEWLDKRATRADPAGLWVLCVSGRCTCGESDWRIAPDWMVPGTHMTSQCPACLGTMEYSEEWERVDRLVTEYSELRPDGDTSMEGSR